MSDCGCKLGYNSGHPYDVNRNECRIAELESTNAELREENQRVRDANYDLTSVFNELRAENERLRLGLDRVREDAGSAWVDDRVEMANLKAENEQLKEDHNFHLRKMTEAECERNRANIEVERLSKERDEWYAALQSLNAVIEKNSQEREAEINRLTKERDEAVSKLNPPGITAGTMLQQLGVMAGDRIRFGLRQQGHMPTIERMLAEGRTWHEIGAVIGWHPPTAKEWYEREGRAPESPVPHKK